MLPSTGLADRSLYAACACQYLKIPFCIAAHVSCLCPRFVVIHVLSVKVTQEDGHTYRTSTVGRRAVAIQ